MVGEEESGLASTSHTFPHLSTSFHTFPYLSHLPGVPRLDESYDSVQNTSSDRSKPQTKLPLLSCLPVCGVLRAKLNESSREWPERTQKSINRGPSERVLDFPPPLQNHLSLSPTSQTLPTSLISQPYTHRYTFERILHFYSLPSHSHSAQRHVPLLPVAVMDHPHAQGKALPRAPPTLLSPSHLLYTSVSLLHRHLPLLASSVGMRASCIFMAHTLRGTRCAH